jgi:hypothetical protein
MPSSTALLRAVTLNKIIVVPQNRIFLDLKIALKFLHFTALRLSKIQLDIRRLPIGEF